MCLLQDEEEGVFGDETTEPSDETAESSEDLGSLVDRSPTKQLNPMSPEFTPSVNGASKRAHQQMEGCGVYSYLCLYYLE